MLDKIILQKIHKKPFLIKPKVYLAGPMEYVKDFGINWRKDIESLLILKGFNVFNPTNEVKLFEELKGVRKNENKSTKLKFGVSKIKNAFQEIQTGKGVNVEGLRYQFSQIVQLDLRNVITSDIIVCNWQKAVFSAGTSGELTVAKLFNIPVIIVTDNIMKLPKWILGCVTIYKKSFDGLIEDINKILKARGKK